MIPVITIKAVTWGIRSKIFIDKGGIFKSFEIEYTLIKDLAFCKPAIHLNPLLINFWVLIIGILLVRWLIIYDEFLENNNNNNN